MCSRRSGCCAASSTDARRSSASAARRSRMAAYAIEGGPSKDYLRTKTFMYEQPASWHRLCALFAESMTTYLRAQVAAGAQALQIFDSWAGALGRADYREFVLPHTRRIFDGLAATGVPLIHFGVGATAILPDLVGGRRPRDRRGLAPGPRRSLDDHRPRRAAFKATSIPPASSARAIACWPPPTTSWRAPAGRPGHIFNLGHGVLPQTPVENVQALAEHVHATRDGDG